MPLFRFLKRRWLLRQPFPDSWEKILETRVPVYVRLPANLRKKLRERITIFLHEKHFEGCGGLELTEEKKVIISAYASVLILVETADYYSDLQSILIYPDDYVAPVHREEGWIVSEGFEPRKGEYWSAGTIVLSWEDIRSTIYTHPTGRNLIYHEFSHQLDDKYGLTAGIDEYGRFHRDDEWSRILASTYRALQKKTWAGAASVLDSYGASHPAELFSVATEAFFEKPDQLYREIPQLYKMLRSFYKLDPVTWKPGNSD